MAYGVINTMSDGAPRTVHHPEGDPLRPSTGLRMTDWPAECANAGVTKHIRAMTSTLPPDLKMAAERMCTGALIVATLALGGCGTVIHERHYFASFNEAPGGKREPTQFFRVNVDGSTSFSNTRYLTGYFDERAVSLFFNEIKAPANQKLFDESIALPGAAAGTKLTPLSPTSDNGAFVLIMSTNADAVASAIGSFAESQAVADALTRIVNRDRIKAKLQSDATLNVQKAQGAALWSQVEALTKSASAAGTGAKAASIYLSTLSTLARGLGYTGPDFAKAEDARTWLNLEESRSGGKQ